MFQTALNAQRVNSLVKTAETMGVLDPASERAKQADLDEILGFLAALEKVINIPYTFTGATCGEHGWQGQVRARSIWVRS